MIALRTLALMAAPSLLGSLLGSPALAKPACARTCSKPSSQEVAFCQGTQCAGLRDKAARRCRRMCGGGGRCAAIRTLAYVVNECRTDAHGLWMARQALRVRRGDCEPVTVMEVPFKDPVQDPLRGPLGQLARAAGFDVPPGGLCQLYGAFRASDALVLVGNFHRLGVSPDGSAIVFEVTDDFAADETPPLADLIPDLLPAPRQEGIFVVSADGTGLRRLGDASRVASFGVIMFDPTNPLLFRFAVAAHLNFSPNGRKVVYTDRPEGQDAVQVVTLDIVTGRRFQVTRLPVAPPISGSLPSTIAADFVDEETIAFVSTANPAGLNPEGMPRSFTVKADGSGLRRVPVPAASPGRIVAERFEITGRKGSAATYELGGEPVNTIEFAEDRPIFEAFVLDGKQLLQLTNFRRSDTFSEFLTANGLRVFFRASANHFATTANPAGTNPSENCQLFSINRLGGHPRQLTFFREGTRSVRGCTEGPPPGCGVAPAFQDPVTGATVFFSGCDPFGTNPYGGQMFAMRLDGSELRQLTDFRGLVTGADGSATVELPGPFAYSERHR